MKIFSATLGYATVIVAILAKIAFAQTDGSNHSKLCANSSECPSACCTHEYSDDGLLKCAPRKDGFDPFAKGCFPPESPVPTTKAGLRGGAIGPEGEETEATSHITNGVFGGSVILIILYATMRRMPPINSCNVYCKFGQKEEPGHTE
jgi:hypothetical protein